MRHAMHTPRTPHAAARGQTPRAARRTPLAGAVRVLTGAVHPQALLSRTTHMYITLRLIFAYSLGRLMLMLLLGFDPVWDSMVDTRAGSVLLAAQARCMQMQMRMQMRMRMQMQMQMQMRMCPGCCNPV